MIEIIVTAGLSLTVAVIIAMGTWIAGKIGGHGERIAAVEAKVDLILDRIPKR